MDGKVLVTLTQRDLDSICQKAAETGAKVALKKMEEERKISQKRIRDRRYHNTEMLLRNYNMFKLSVKNSVFTIRQMEKEASANEILNLMMDSNKDEITINAIRDSKEKTAIIVKHIDTMLELYQVYCERSADKMDNRRYEILMDRFIRNPTLSVTEIATKNCISKETVYSDLKIAKERVSALIFGIEGLSRH